MKRTGLTRSFSACRMTVSVWGMTPSTASTTRMTPSMALMALVTSPPKSTCPGVSMRLMRYSSASNLWTMEAMAALMVMPRACSCSS